MKAICNINVPVESKASTTSSKTDMKTEASKSKTGQSDKETQSSLVKDKSPSHPSPSILVVGEMHKEAQQAAGGPTSLGDTSEKRAHPHLSSGTNPSVLVDKNKSAGDGLKTIDTNLGTNEESRSDEISKKIKIEDLSNLMQDTRSAFLTPDSPQDEPTIFSDESEEEETKKYEDTHTSSHYGPEDTLIPHPPSAKSIQIQEFMAQVHLLQSQKDEYLPTKLKEIPSKITELSGDVKEIKKHVRGMEIELLGDIKEIPKKLETFTSTISSLTSQAKDKGVPSAGKSNASPVEGEKNTYSATKEANLKSDLVDLMGINVVEKYHKKKLLYDKYCDKMLKRRKSPKIINFDVLTKKGHITLKVYREDGTDEVISNFKIDFNKPLKEQDPLNELNDLANKKRKRTDELKDHSRSTKKHKSSVQHEEE
ncbi:hypothetical protein Tco_0879459, partial [Tanacetum coccineum]